MQLPPILRPLMGGERYVRANGDTIGAVLADFVSRHPAMALHFFDEQHAIRHNIVFIHDGVVIRARDARNHPLKADDELVITTALAGG